MGRICTQRDGQDRFARSELDTPGHCRSRIACRASARQPIITRDVTEEPRWKPWLWLANEFDYRACWSFPVETSSGSSAFCHVFQEASRSDRKRTPIRLSVSSRCRRRPCHDRILRCNDGWVQCPRWPQRIPRVEENPAPPKLRIWPPTSRPQTIGVFAPRKFSASPRTSSARTPMLTITSALRKWWKRSENASKNSSDVRFFA